MIKWRIISEFPDYEISEFGTVRRLVPHARSIVSGEVQAHRNPINGYWAVQIRRNGKRYNRYVHRLVATAFIPNPDGLPEVNHDNGDKDNNHKDNLEWSTRSANNSHKNRVLKHHHNRRLYIAYRDREDPIHFDNMVEFCERHNLTGSACVLVAQGTRNHHKGWRFAYADQPEAA